MKISEVTLKYVEQMPSPGEKEEGILYISEKFRLAIHLCACGCGIETVTPTNKWKLKTEKDGTVTLSPSIGNFNGEHPYHAHYFIRKNKIIWV